MSVRPSLAQKVTLAEKNASLIDVFQQIRKQTGYDFLFTGSDIKNAKPVTIDVKDEELNNVLDQIFQGQPLEFSIEKQIRGYSCQRSIRARPT